VGSINPAVRRRKPGSWRNKTTTPQFPEPPEDRQTGGYHWRTR
jgi:hypothetical protein